MGGQDSELKGPDFEKGMSMTAVPDGGMIEGHAFGEVILVARRGHEVFAIGANCTHYGASLKNGLLVGDTVRCPWHHACFSLRTGEALRAPALTDTSCWKVERRNDTFYISGKAKDQKKGTPLLSPESVVIIGAGAAGGAPQPRCFDGRAIKVLSRCSAPMSRYLTIGRTSLKTIWQEAPLKNGFHFVLRNLSRPRHCHDHRTCSHRDRYWGQDSCPFKRPISKFWGRCCLQQAPPPTGCRFQATICACPVS